MSRRAWERLSESAGPSGAPPTTPLRPRGRRFRGECGRQPAAAVQRRGPDRRPDERPAPGSGRRRQPAIHEAPAVEPARSEPLYSNPRAARRGRAPARSPPADQVHVRGRAGLAPRPRDDPRGDLRGARHREGVRVDWSRPARSSRRTSRSWMQFKDGRFVSTQKPTYPDQCAFKPTESASRLRRDLQGRRRPADVHLGAADPAARPGARDRQVELLQRVAPTRAGLRRGPRVGPQLRAPVAEGALTRWTAVAAVLGAGAAAEAAVPAVAGGLRIAHFAAGATLGCLSASLLGRNRTAALVGGAATVAWFLGTLADAEAGWAASIGGACALAYRGPRPAPAAARSGRGAG